MLNIASKESRIEVFIEALTALFFVFFLSLSVIGDVYTLACHFLNDWIFKKCFFKETLLQCIYTDK